MVMTAASAAAGGDGGGREFRPSRARARAPLQVILQSAMAATVGRAAAAAVVARAPAFTQLSIAAHKPLHNKRTKFVLDESPATVAATNQATSSVVQQSRAPVRTKRELKKCFVGCCGGVRSCRGVETLECGRIATNVVCKLGLKMTNRSRERSSPDFRL